MTRHPLSLLLPVLILRAAELSRTPRPVPEPEPAPPRRSAELLEAQRRDEALFHKRLRLPKTGS